MTEPAPILSVASRTEFTWVRWKAIALAGISSAHTRRSYDRALRQFHAWYKPVEHGPLSKKVVQEYRGELEGRGLSPSSINLELAALRKLASEAINNGLLSPEVGAEIAQVRGVRYVGRKAGTCLTQMQAQQLLMLPNPATLKGKRDQALLALLLGCGLRRSELAALTVSHFEQRDGRSVIIDLVGKGKRVRSIPTPSWARAAVDRWIGAARITEGKVLLPVNKADRVCGAGMTAQSIFEIVERYSRVLGIRFVPHDLRRTFARLAHLGHAPLEQIQLSLGHASAQTTERYLGLEQNLIDAPCDHLGLSL